MKCPLIAAMAADKARRRDAGDAGNVHGVDAGCVDAVCIYVTPVTPSQQRGRNNPKLSQRPMKLDVLITGGMMSLPLSKLSCGTR